MVVSILHRATGTALSIAGLALLTWWLMAIATGPAGYADFTRAATHPLGIALLVALTWSFFQHLLSGVRHLVMDSGGAFELGVNKRFAIATLIGSVILTALFWTYELNLLGGGRQ